MIFDPLPNREADLPCWAKNAPAGMTGKGVPLAENGHKLAKTLLKIARAAQHKGPRGRVRGHGRRESWTYAD